MKRMFRLLTVMVVVGFAVSARGALIMRGTDTLGNRLIYDTDLNITWYDYTNPIDTWQNQVNWVAGLSVTLESNTYSDWRLPTTVDGVLKYGYKGPNPDGSYSYTDGYNLYNSEMGHLFYTELGNLGYYDTTGTYVGDGKKGLLNSGDFQNLRTGAYWSGTGYSAGPNRAWYFLFNDGIQYVDGKNGPMNYALAVRSGDVAVPEPMTVLLLGLGGLVLKRRRSRNTLEGTQIFTD